MENKLGDEFINVCKTLNKNSVQYLIVGGTAVALYGYFRVSTGPSGLVGEKPDVDIWYNPTYDNYFRLLNVLEQLGQDVSEFKEEQAPNPRKSFFKFNTTSMTLDFLPQIKADIKFIAAFGKKEVVAFDQVNINFISYHDLIEDKKVNPRDKDLEDIKHLEAIRKNKDSDVP